MAAALQFLRRLIIVWELRVVDSATAICCGVVRVRDRIRDSLVFTSERAMTQSQSSVRIESDDHGDDQDLYDQGDEDYGDDQGNSAHGYSDEDPDDDQVPQDD
jgi:hypothetical protein